MICFVKFNLNFDAVMMNNFTTKGKGGFLTGRIQNTR